MSVIVKVLLCVVASVAATQIEHVKPHTMNRVVEITSEGNAVVNRLETTNAESAEAEEAAGQPTFQLSHDSWGFAKLGPGYCRGSNINDKGFGWHHLACSTNQTGQSACTQWSCEQMCNNNANCKGIEFSSLGSCELWYHYPCFTSGVNNGNHGVCMIKDTAQQPAVTHCPAGSPANPNGVNQGLNQNGGNWNNGNQGGANQNGANGGFGATGWNGANTRSGATPAPGPPRSSAFAFSPSSAVVTTSAIWFALALARVGH